MKMVRQLFVAKWQQKCGWSITRKYLYVNGHKLITPPVSEGWFEWCYEKQILSLAKNRKFRGRRRRYFSFDLQKQMNYFITNVKGIQPITQYRKKKNFCTYIRSIIGET
jgi:hypothetical protein